MGELVGGNLAVMRAVAAHERVVRMERALDLAKKSLEQQMSYLSPEHLAEFVRLTELSGTE